MKLNKMLLVLITNIIFISCMSSSNNDLAMPNDYYVQKTEQFHELMKSQQISWDNKCQHDIFGILDSLEILSDKDLRLVSPVSTELGGRKDCIYLFDISGNEDNNYMKYVRLKSISASSLWQWILLYTLPTTYNISNYSQRIIQKRQFVITEDIWHNIIDNQIPIIPDSVWENAEEVEAGYISEKEYTKLSKMKIQPLDICIDESTMMAEIAFCSWDSSSGLICNHYQLQINADNTVEIISLTYKSIVPYNSGIF